MHSKIKSSDQNKKGLNRDITIQNNFNTLCSNKQNQTKNNTIKYNFNYRIQPKFDERAEKNIIFDAKDARVPKLNLALNPLYNQRKQLIKDNLMAKNSKILFYVVIYDKNHETQRKKYFYKIFCIKN